MPANKGGDSKQGLIIALVISILLVITLGVVAYYGYDGQAVLDKKAKDAAAAEAATKKNRDGWKLRALKMQEYLGDLKNGEERTWLDANRSAGGLDIDNKAEFDQLQGKLDQLLVKEGGKKEFESYSDKVSRLSKELSDSRALLAKADDNLRRALAANAKEKQEHADTIASLMDKHNKDLTAERDKYTAIEKNLEAKLNEFGDLTKQLTDQKKLSEGDKANLEKSIKSLRTQVEALNRQIVKLQEKLTPPDLFRFDVPKGKIVRLDPKGELAWVDVGSADNIKPHESLTFAIFGSSAGARAGGERKGALEIVNVQGPHLSLAKVTDVTDQANNPIVPGDLLINPAWSPANRTHVALAGLFDLTGEGRDQIGEFMRTLQKEGVVIDAYLDLRDHTIKGDGMSIKTDYLVIGEEPSFDERSTVLRLTEQRQLNKADISDKITEMKNVASKFGATVVPFRRFVLLTGYRLPKGVGIHTGVGYDYIRPSDTLSDKPAKGKEKAKPKEEKKDDEDK